MNLHGVVRGAIQAVNPDTLVSWQTAIGYTTNNDGTRNPLYSVSNAPMQVQAVSAWRLQQLEKLNITGVLRRIYAFGNVQGVVRPDFKGGDLLAFPQQYGGNPQLWKVVQVSETWPDVQSNGWSDVIVQLQTDISGGAALITGAGSQIDTGNNNPLVTGPTEQAAPVP